MSENLAPLQAQNQQLKAQVAAIYRLSKAFVEASHEGEIVAALLKLSVELVGAQGASFVPLDEHGQPQAMLSHGRLDSPLLQDWVEYLAVPAVRASCQTCEAHGQLNLEQSCPLLHSPLDGAAGMFCLPVSRGEQELGMLNLYLPEGARLDEDRQAFLGILVDETALALDAMRMRQREANDLSLMQSIMKDASNRKEAGLQGSHASPVESVRESLEKASLIAEIEYQSVREERSRLAREIHDGLAQTLGLLKLQAAQLRNYIKNNDLEKLSQSAELNYATIQEAYQDARQMIDGLRLWPDGSGMAGLLSQAAADFEELTGLPVHLSLAEQGCQLEPEVQAQLIRIVQEALNNTRKHSQANQVWISAAGVDGEYRLEVRDDGAGFSPEDDPGRLHYGLRGMRERAALIGADLQVHSQAGAGTRLLIRIPLSGDDAHACARVQGSPQ